MANELFLQNSIVNTGTVYANLDDKMGHVYNSVAMASSNGNNTTNYTASLPGGIYSPVPGVIYTVAFFLQLGGLPSPTADTPIDQPTKMLVLSGANVTTYLGTVVNVPAASTFFSGSNNLGNTAMSKMSAGLLIKQYGFIVYKNTIYDDINFLPAVFS